MLTFDILEYTCNPSLGLHSDKQHNKMRHIQRTREKTAAKYLDLPDPQDLGYHYIYHYHADPAACYPSNRDLKRGEMISCELIELFNSKFSHSLTGQPHENCCVSLCCRPTSAERTQRQ